MNQDVIVDTSGLIAFFVQSETHHSAAKQYYVEYPRRWIILGTVFNETVTWIRAKISIQASIKISQVLREEHYYFPVSAADDDLIWEVFRKYDDKAWSYTDCSILMFAQKLKVFEVFSFDHHICQMSGLGIVCVPGR